MERPTPAGTMRGEDGEFLDPYAIHRRCEATRLRLVAALRASRAEVERLRGILVDARALIADEWTGTNGPIGEGAEVMARIDASLGGTAAPTLT